MDTMRMIKNTYAINVSMVAKNATLHHYVFNAIRERF